MHDDPYTPPKAELDGETPRAAGPRLYAKLRPRMYAFLIDYLLVVCSFVLVGVAGSHLENIRGAGALLFLLWAACALLYEPVTVWRTGGTLGHHLTNISVVSRRTGGNPTFFAALVRSLIKAFLGGVSFLWMLVSERRQAIHDAVVGVTVEIRNETVARRRDYVQGPM